MAPSTAVAIRPPDKGFVSNRRSSGISSGAGDDDSKAVYLSVEKLRGQYYDFLQGKVAEIEEARQARQYFHAAQWTAKELRQLRDRRSPIITFNEISKKINAIVGLTEKLRQDPKAFPRNPRDEEGAEVAGSTVRYVLDANDWKTLSSEVARHCAIDGLGGVALKLRAGDKGDPDIEIEPVWGDDFFYDLRSYRPDFHDSRYLGMGRWVDEDACIEIFPDLEEEIRGLVENGTDLTTRSDREYKWVYSKERRLRLVEHWYKHRGQWCWAFYIGSTILDEGVSPFVNERGKTIPRFIMFSAAVDHDSDRYGFVRNYKGAQDEINHRRTKGLFISNSRRLISDKGAVDDVETARREWARPDGFIEKNPGLDIHPDDTSADLAGQLQFLQDAKQWMDKSAPSTPVMPGSEQMPKEISGYALNLLQQAGTAELGPYLLALRGWKLRVYQAIWCMAQKFWTAERWIRVTDDQDMAKFIQLNGLDLDQFGRPMLVNYLGQLNVDIIMDEGPDVVNLQQDSLQILLQAQAGGAQIPPQIMAELMPLPASTKKRWIAMMNQPPDPVEMAGKQYAVDRIKAEIEEKNAGTLQRVATAAYRASQAHLNADEVLNRGYEDMSKLQGTPAAPGTPPLPSGPPPTPPQAAPPMPQQPLPGPLQGQPPPPLPGARMAPDGRHYIPDPRRPGKYLMVA